MKKVFFSTIAVLMSLSASAQRHIESLNFGWEFRLNDIGDWKQVIDLSLQW